MKILKNADYDYEANGISEENGWTKYYDWETVRRHTRIISIALTALLAVFAFIFKDFFAMNGLVGCITAIITAVLIFILIITPLHEILHLIPHSKKLDDNCIISIYKTTVSALYNGFSTRKQELISLLLPFLVLSAILLPIVLFTSGWFKIFSVILFILTALGSYTDIYMFFYLLKRLKPNEKIFGLFKKTT